MSVTDLRPTQSPSGRTTTGTKSQYREPNQRAAERQAAYRAADIARWKCKEACRRAVIKGQLTRPDTCSQCGRTDEPIWAHHKDFGKPLDVVWLCRPCYQAVNPRLKHVVPKKRKQAIRKCPPYDVMRRDYVELGLSQRQMARKYGVAHGVLGKTFARRARVFGESLDQLKEQRQTKVKVDMIWEIVREYMSQEANPSVAIVSMKSAVASAPRCFVPRHGETWPKHVTRYHRMGCPRVGKGETFTMDTEEAQDWGYVACVHCEHGLSLEEFGRRHGISTYLLTGINTGRIRTITFSRARQLLTAVGEPIPGWLTAC